MMGWVRTVVALSACLSLPTASRASMASDLRSIDGRLKACLAKNDSNAGMTACTSEAYNAASRVLKGIYEGQTAKLQGGSTDDKESLARLIASQRAWITYRDNDCKLQGITMLGGSGEGSIIVGCLLEATKQRARSLDHLFSDVQ